MHEVLQQLTYSDILFRLLLALAQLLHTSTHDLAYLFLLISTFALFDLLNTPADDLLTTTALPGIGFNLFLYRKIVPKFFSGSTDVLLLVISFVIAVYAFMVPAVTGESTYINTDINYEISYPANWQIQSDIVYPLMSNAMNNTAFIGPNISDKIVIIVTNKQTADQYLSSGKAQIDLKMANGMLLYEDTDFDADSGDFIIGEIPHDNQTLLLFMSMRDEVAVRYLKSFHFIKPT